MKIRSLSPGHVGEIVQNALSRNVENEESFKKFLDQDPEADDFHEC